MGKPSNQLKDFDDPLFSIGEKKRKSSTVIAPISQSHWSRVSVITLIVVLFVLSYSVLQSQWRMEDMKAVLTENQNHLSSLTQKLEVTIGKVGVFEENLSQSRSKLRSQGRQIVFQKGLYGNLKLEQEQHNLQLGALTGGKADRNEVSTLKKKAENLRIETMRIQSGVDKVSSDVARIREDNMNNLNKITTNHDVISQIQKQSDTTKKNLSKLQKSLSRDYYNFELHEKAGKIKVFDILIGLKDVNLRRGQYNLEVFAAGKRLRWKKRHVNEPIYFYMKADKKPYEIVVTRLGKKTVAGYLSTSK